jgi:hypothetical protein
MKHYFRFHRNGQSLVEFALILPVFLLMAIMVFDLGRAVYYLSTIHNAAREAARYGIVHPDDITGMEDKGIQYAVGLGLTHTNFNPAITIINPTNRSDLPIPSVKVYINYNFIPATPLVSRFISGGTIHLKGEATMKLEALPQP